MRAGFAAITDTGGREFEGGFPTVSKKTMPGRWRKASATSTGVMPSRCAGRVGIRKRVSSIAAATKSRCSAEASRKLADALMPRTLTDEMKSRKAIHHGQDKALAVLMHTRFPPPPRA